MSWPPTEAAPIADAAQCRRRRNRGGPESAPHRIPVGSRGHQRLEDIVDIVSKRSRRMVQLEWNSLRATTRFDPRRFPAVWRAPGGDCRGSPLGRAIWSGKVLGTQHELHAKSPLETCRGTRHPRSIAVHVLTRAARPQSSSTRNRALDRSVHCKAAFDNHQSLQFALQLSLSPTRRQAYAFRTSRKPSSREPAQPPQHECDSSSKRKWSTSSSRVLAGN